MGHMWYVQKQCDDLHQVFHFSDFDFQSQSQPNSHSTSLMELALWRQMRVIGVPSTRESQGATVPTLLARWQHQNINT